MAAEVVDRNLAIMRAIDAGETIVALATRYGISRQRVQQICARLLDISLPTAIGHLPRHWDGWLDADSTTGSLSVHDWLRAKTP